MIFWKDDIKLMLNGCHNCWSYKVIKFAFETKLNTGTVSE